MRVPPSITDPGLPSLARALDAAEMRVHLQHVCAAGNRLVRAELRGIHLLRHKIGRRCLIEYELRLRNDASSDSSLTVLGKLGHRKADRRTYELVTALWHGGFDSGSRDRISVPRPVAIIPDLHMWLQVKVSGATSAEALCAPGGVGLARRLADAIHKLHAKGPSSNRRHTIMDELDILRDRLRRVEAMRPEWTRRLRRVIDACGRLANRLPRTRLTGIHRDFYPDQVLVGRSGRLFVLDLDLYTMGDPMLDVGNFTGHLMELAIRRPPLSARLGCAIAAFESRYVELTGDSARHALSVYTTLTLARHIYLSTQFPDRQHVTARLLHLCEERVAGGERSRAVSPTEHPLEACR